MSVDLEKIASMMDNAYEEISKLEQEKEELMSKIASLEEDLSLLKQAEDNSVSWVNKGMIDGEPVNIRSSYDSAESRLDEFLNG